MIAIAELAKQLGRDRSSLLKRIKNDAIPTSLERVKTAGGTQSLRCMSDQDAEKIRRQIQADATWTREARVREFCSVLLHLLTIVPHLDSGDLERVWDAIKVLRPPLKGNMTCDRCGNRFEAGDTTWNPTIVGLFLCEECWENSDPDEGQHN